MQISIANRLRIFIPFALGYFLSYLYRAINAVLAPNLAADLGVDPSELGLLTSAYFITFALFQVPLGVLLDRFGPRRIEAALLVVAAAGAWVFAHATSLTGLLVGRGLIGFGVSACLMAAFKAFVIWFPPQQLPRLNGIQMASGGLGALAATAPVEAALSITDWRGMFAMLAGVTLVVAAVIFFVVPVRRTSNSDLTLREQIRGIGRVLTSMSFWRIAPWATLTQGSFMSIQGLWAGPYLRDVAGFDRSQVAGTLLLMAVAMVTGYLILGMAAERLSRRGIAPLNVAATGMGLFMIQLALLLLPLSSAAAPVWMLFGFFGTSGILVYAVLSQSFPIHLAGRANTALNLMVFTTAFAAQWGVGTIIELWPVTAAGHYALAGYQAAFAVLLALQSLALLWYFLSGFLRRGPAAKEPI